MNTTRREFLFEGGMAALALPLLGAEPISITIPPVPASEDRKLSAKKANNIVVDVPVMRAGYVTDTGRIYPKFVLEKLVRDFAKRTELMVGQINFPQKATVQLADMSHIVKDIYMDDEILMAKIEILSTPSGLTLTELMKSNAVSFRTMCMYTENERGRPEQSEVLTDEREDYDMNNEHDVLACMTRGLHILGDDIELLGIHAVDAKVASNWTQFCDDGVAAFG